MKKVSDLVIGEKKPVRFGKFDAKEVRQYSILQSILLNWILFMDMVPKRIFNLTNQSSASL